MGYLLDDCEAPEGCTWLYRTKDFKAIPHTDGFEIIGTHKDAIAWLVDHRGDNLREQFLNASGQLIAADDDEVQPLIMALQEERGA